MRIAVLYVLLFCCMYVNGASSSNVVFYSDAKERSVRLELLQKVKTGPIRELDAYISYISDVAYLSDSESASNTPDGLQKVFMCKALADVFDVSELSDDSFQYILTKTALKGIEAGIDLGLKQLAKQKLTKSEIDGYYRLNCMIKRLADSVHEDKQALFWQQYMRTFSTREAKIAVFNFYVSLKKNMTAAHSALNSYYHLLDQALKAQFIDNDVQS